MISNKYKITRYCNEDMSNIENYEIAVNSELLYDCHHRLELEDENGIKRDTPFSIKELKTINLYYHRPASELIFIEHSEHTRLHHKGKHMSEESKKKISEAARNISEETRQKMSNARKGKHHSEETKKLLSEKGKNMTQEHREKLSKALKGRHHSEETKKKLSESHKNPSEEVRRKNGEKNKGKHWGVDKNGKRYWYA